LNTGVSLDHFACDLIAQSFVGQLRAGQFCAACADASEVKQATRSNLPAQTHRVVCPWATVGPGVSGTAVGLAVECLSPDRGEQRSVDRATPRFLGGGNRRGATREFRGVFKGGPDQLLGRRVQIREREWHGFAFGWRELDQRLKVQCLHKSGAGEPLLLLSTGQI